MLNLKTQKINTFKLIFEKDNDIVRMYSRKMAGDTLFDRADRLIWDELTKIIFREVLSPARINTEQLLKTLNMPHVRV